MLAMKNRERRETKRRNVEKKEKEKKKKKKKKKTEELSQKLQLVSLSMCVYLQDCSEE